MSGLFILLGARIDGETLRQVEWRNIVFLGILVVIVRPLSVLCSTIGSGLSRNERIFLGLTALRGIVAAAIASVFSLRLVELQVPRPDAGLGHLHRHRRNRLLSGLGSRRLARRLRLATDRTVVIVLGANVVARELASALERAKVPTRLVDLDRQELARARMTGLYAHQGSVYADSTWESIGIHEAAAFLAVTSNDDLNTVAARHAAATLDRKNVYQLQPRGQEHAAWWTFAPGTFARPLFDQGVTWDTLAARIEAGDRVSVTALTDQFTMEDHRRTHGESVVLFRVRNGVVHFRNAESTDHPAPGDVIVALTQRSGPTPEAPQEAGRAQAVKPAPSSPTTSQPS
ncbi:MAG: NAD-binding protein [Ilumatobacteraceae bacterium]